MDQDVNFPLIETKLDGDEKSPFSLPVIRGILKKILPQKFFDLYKSYPETGTEMKEYLQEIFPLTYRNTCVAFPSNLSFTVLSKYRANAFKFCFEMISRWLVPGKRLDVQMLYAVDFSMPELGDDVYTVFEIVMRIGSEDEWQELQRNLPIIEAEIRLGVVSSYYAQRILEVKGLANDEKTAMIQEYIAYMIRRLSSLFSTDIFTEMQHVLIMCRDDFKACRSVRHLSRIISVQYLFRKEIRKAMCCTPDKRHLLVKVFKANLQEDKKGRSVLALMVGSNFLRDKEVLEERHLLKAVQHYVPSAIRVKHSYFSHRIGNEKISVLYLEVEKKEDAPFSGEEMRLLKKELPTDLKGRIQYLMPSVFMPRNEEEVMRNILTLSQQIKFVRDIPQMFISFDEQTDAHLFFTVIIVRVLREKTPSIASLFKKFGGEIEYIHDRTKAIGYLRNKYKKQATVFQLKIEKKHFIRHDHSIDLYKARQAVVDEVFRVIGEVRDYNGGMISKQNELFMRVKKLFVGKKKYNEILLENFFYSLHPVVMRTVLEPHAIEKLFTMLLDFLGEGGVEQQSYDMKIRAEPDALYVMIASHFREIEGELGSVLEEMEFSYTTLAQVNLHVNDTFFNGFIFYCDDPLKQRKFCTAMQHVAELCKNRVVNTHVS